MADRDYLLILIGALGFIVLSHQIPVLRSLNSLKTDIKGIDDIEGIDLNLLSICRQKGLL